METITGIVFKNCHCLLLWEDRLCLNPSGPLSTFNQTSGDPGMTGTPRGPHTPPRATISSALCFYSLGTKRTLTKNCVSRFPLTWPFSVLQPHRL